MVGFLNKAIIVRIPFSYRDKSEKQIKKKQQQQQLFIDQN